MCKTITLAWYDILYQLLFEQAWNGPSVKQKATKFVMRFFSGKLWIGWGHYIFYDTEDDISYTF